MICTRTPLLPAAIVALTLCSSLAFGFRIQVHYKWHSDCDYNGADLKSVGGVSNTCGHLCAIEAQCTHWSWTDFNGGTCWLKKSETATITMSAGQGYCGYVTDRVSLADPTQNHEQYIPALIEQKPGQVEPAPIEQNAGQLLYDQIVQTAGQVQPAQIVQNPGQFTYAQIVQTPAQVQPAPIEQNPGQVQPAQIVQNPIQIEQNPVQNADPPTSWTFPNEKPVETPEAPPCENGLTTAENAQMLASINSYRADNGLPALTIDNRLVAAALVHSLYQAKYCVMQHEGTGGSTPGDRMKSQNYIWSSSAENVAAGQKNVSEVMLSWWNSPHHRENILRVTVTHVGFALVPNDACEYKCYWTQDFGAEQTA